MGSNASAFYARHAAGYLLCRARFKITPPERAKTYESPNHKRHDDQAGTQPIASQRGHRDRNELARFDKSPAELEFRFERTISSINERTTLSRLISIDLNSFEPNSPRSWKSFLLNT